MRAVTHTAQFGPGDPVARMLDDIACPACGYRDPTETYRLTPGNRVRFFCDGCGAFVTIVLSDAQAGAVQHWSSEPGDRTPR
jgi:hypothetical protein